MACAILKTTFIFHLEAPEILAHFEQNDSYMSNVTFLKNAQLTQMSDLSWLQLYVFLFDIHQANKGHLLYVDATSLPIKFPVYHSLLSFPTIVEQTYSSKFNTWSSDFGKAFIFSFEREYLLAKFAMALWYFYWRYPPDLLNPQLYISWLLPWVLYLNQLCTHNVFQPLVNSLIFHANRCR